MKPLQQVSATLVLPQGQDIGDDLVLPSLSPVPRSLG